MIKFLIGLLALLAICFAVGVWRKQRHALPRAIDGQPKPRNLKERSKIVERLAVTIVLVAHTVAYLQEFKDHTAIHFVGGLSAEGRAMIVGVREKPDTIHLANPLHAA
jgi:hypothetical protein